MPEKMLYLLNVSNPDRLSADSGWLFAEILAPALVDQGVAVTVACPVPVSDPRVGHVAVPSPGSKYRVRFSADVGAAAALVARVDPTVVVVNQIEQAGALRAALVEAGSSARLVGYCHYLPFHVDGEGRVRLDPAMDDGGLARSVFMQFVTGLTALDRILVHSPVAEQWLARACTSAGVDLSGRVRVVPPPRDPRLVADLRSPRAGGEVTVVYNHRLYEHYGTGRFLELAAQLTADPSVRLVVMDLFGDRHGARRSLDASPERYREALAELPGVRIVSDGGDRERYRQILAGADFGLAPFRAGCTWSMSVVDCQAMGVPVLAPRFGWLATAVDQALLFDEPHQAVKLVRALTGDPRERAAAGRIAAAGTRALAPELVAARYLAAIA